MKKADILAAKAHAGDPCAVFEIETRIGTRYCRLMTDAEIKAADDSRYSHVRRNGGNSSVSIVYVGAVDTHGSFTDAYGERAVATFHDLNERDYLGTGVYSDRKESDTKPVAHIKQCVNADQSFADFITAEYARQREAARQQSERQERQRIADYQQKERLKELNERIKELVGESPHMMFVDRCGEVRIKLDALARLVDLAETHATSTLSAGA